MLFRPEEIHPGSPERPRIGWSSDLAVGIANDAFGRVGCKDIFVPHLD
jgi:hypothetical protein